MKPSGEDSINRVIDVVLFTTGLVNRAVLKATGRRVFRLFLDSPGEELFK